MTTHLTQLPRIGAENLWQDIWEHRTINNTNSSRHLLPHKIHTTRSNRYLTKQGNKRTHSPNIYVAKTIIHTNSMSVNSKRNSRVLSSTITSIGA